jgi:hypothetical protein
MRHWVSISLVFGIMLSLFSPVLAAGSPSEDIPLDSWVYDAVFELSSRGEFSALLLHTRPYTRGEVADGLSSILADEPQLTGGRRFLVERLKREFAEELCAGETTSGGDHEYVRLGAGPTARVDQFRQGYARNRAGLDAVGTFGVGKSFCSRVRVRFDTDARHDTQFHGVYWPRDSLAGMRFTAWVEQAITSFRYKHFRAAFGREYWRWGRSPVDVLLLSDHSPPFDGLRVGFRASKWSYTFHATALDRMTTAQGVSNRYLAAHRLDWRPRRNLELAFSEVMVYGGVNRPWEWNYLNPILPYYWEQLNNGINDNPLWNLECSWRPRRGLELYGELMIDDFQIDFHSEPQQIGFSAGLAWSELGFNRLFINMEYERINTFVYGQDYPHNRYMHFADWLRGEAIGIGSDLGTDADRISFRPRWHQSAFLDFTGLLEIARNGEGRIDHLQDTPVPKGIKFPSGVVQTRLTAGLGTHLQTGGNLVLDLSAGYQRVTNVRNQQGVDQAGAYFRVRLAALIWKTYAI